MSTGVPIAQPRAITDEDLVTIRTAIATRRPIGWLHAHGMLELLEQTCLRNEQLEAELRDVRTQLQSTRVAGAA